MWHDRCFCGGLLAQCLVLLFAVLPNILAGEVCFASENRQNHCGDGSVCEASESRSYPESFLQIGAGLLGQTSFRSTPVNRVIEEEGEATGADAIAAAGASDAQGAAAVDVAVNASVPRAQLQRTLDGLERRKGSGRSLFAVVSEAVLNHTFGVTSLKTWTSGSIQVPALVLGVALTCVIAGALLMAFFLSSSEASDLDEKAWAPDREYRGQPPVQTRSPSPGKGFQHDAASLPQQPRGSAALSRELSTSTPPQASGRRQRHLCPGLVVPRGSECLLSMPVTPIVLGDVVSFQARDLGGKPVITVDLRRAAELASPASSQAIAVLRVPGKNGLGDALASCRASQGADGERAAVILNIRQEVFASIARVSARSYVLTGQGGSPQMKFEGEIANHSVIVSQREEGGGDQLLAETEPAVMTFDQEGSYYQLRVCSGQDVGLILCGLLAVGRLEAAYSMTSK